MKFSVQREDADVISAIDGGGMRADKDCFLPSLVFYFQPAARCVGRGTAYNGHENVYS
ncbi:MAG: hypothetical protein L0229_19970 [Blastocatellia bacterium]|nr:hypothetical protein [Blastocatellia bacterium]